MTNLIRRFAGTFQLVFVVAVVGSAILLSATLKPEATSRAPAGTPGSVGVSVVEPVQDSYTPSVELNGVVEARTTVEVMPQVGGRVVEVSPDYRVGGFIRSGDVLFRIDPSDYQLAVERTMAEIEGARSDLALLEAQAAAEQQVWDSQFPGKKIPDLIARVPQIAAARARIRSGEAAREAALLNLRRSTVYAPFDGRVLETRLDVGQVVGANATVGTIFPTDDLEIAVPVSSDEIALIGDLTNSVATVTSARSGERAMPGSVVRVAAALDERTRLGTLYVKAEGDSLMLGEFVSVSVEGHRAADTYRLPAASLTSRDRVWVVADGRLEERRVDILGREGDLFVVAGFDSADGVVTVPPSDVREGLPVEIRSQNRLASTGGLASAAR